MNDVLNCVFLNGALCCNLGGSLAVSLHANPKSSCQNPKLYKFESRLLLSHPSHLPFSLPSHGAQGGSKAEAEHDGGRDASLDAEVRAAQRPQAQGSAVLGSKR